jgi:IclR family pca regulon transcriptional regulator
MSAKTRTADSHGRRGEAERNPPLSLPTAGRGTKSEGRDREFVRGFERGVAVIKAFDAQMPALTVTQVAERARLTRAVARRYLLTLETLGYVTQRGTAYSLTPRVLEIGFAYLSSTTVADIARPWMLQVVDTLQESCSIAVLDREDVVYVARVPARRIMTTNLLVGSRLPAHATSLGHVLLAYLPPARLEAYFATASLQPLTEKTITDTDDLRRALDRVRRRGWAENDEASEKGVRTVAVPLMDRTGDVIAAMNLSGHASRVTMRDLRQHHLPVLLNAAREISRALGAERGPAATLPPEARDDD